MGCLSTPKEHCSAQGLRKAGATLAAGENGATEHQLMAIFGWSSAKMAELYTRKARRKRLAGAAMHLISTEQKASTGTKGDERSPTSAGECPSGTKKPMKSVLGLPRRASLALWCPGADYALRLPLC